MRTWFRSLLMPRSLLGLALFVLPWLWVLGAFAPRTLFVKQITGNTGFPPAVPWVGSLPFPYGIGNWGTGSIPPSFETDFVTDPQVQAKIAEQTARNVKSSSPKANKFAELSYYQGIIGRFPRESWLHAHYLRIAVNAFDDERTGGAFSSTGPVSLYTNAPESTGLPPNFSPEQLDTALKIARQGQALEPDNAFFGLCEGVLLWMGHRDAEAWRVLHRASLLSRYDDHTQDDIQATLKVNQLQYGPSLWEQKLVASVMVSSGPNAKLREKARQWSWAAWKLERTGHHREAIAKRADLARLFGKTVHGRNTLINGLVGAAIQASMWAGNPNRRVTTRQMTSQQRADVAYRVRFESQKFADYARAHGEPAIAAETMRLGEATSHFRALSRVSIDDSKINNIPQPLVYQTRALWWTACELLGSGALILGVWLVTEVLLIGAGGKRAKARFVVPVVLLCGALVALIYNTYNGALTEEYMVMPPHGTISPKAIRFMGVLQVVALLLPLALPALLCGVPTGLKAWRERRAAKLRARKSIPVKSTSMGDAPASTAETEAQPALQNPIPQTDAKGHLPRDMRPLVWSFLSWCAPLGVLGGWIFAAALWVDPTSVLPIGSTGNAETLTLYVVISAALSSALWLAGWIIQWRFFAPLAERPLRHSALRRFNTTLGVLLIVGSWSYALTLHATLAPRREADRLAALELQLGEIGVLEANHAQVTQTRKSTP